MVEQGKGSGNDDVSELINQINEGLTGVVATYISLHQRGKVIRQQNEVARRRSSYSMKTRRLSSKMNLLRSSGANHMNIPNITDHPDILNTTSKDGSSMNTNHSTIPSIQRLSSQVRFDSQDDLDEMVEQSIQCSRNNRNSNSISGTSSDKSMMMITAIIALWTHHRVAAGFRQWKERSQTATDLIRLEKYGPNLHMDARNMLITAEMIRQNTMAASEIDSSIREVQLSRNDLDVLILWARSAHPKTFRGVDDASICDVMRHFRFKQYEDGETLFLEGEVGETFYILVQGTIAVFVGMNAHIKSKLSTVRKENRNMKIDWTQLGKRVFTYRTGDSFGETAMFCNDATRTATVVAVGPCEVCELHRDIYRRTLRKYHQAFFEQTQKLNFMQRVALFRDWTRQKLVTLADLLEKRRLTFGETLLIEKSMEPVNQCYLVLSGVLKLTKMVSFHKETHFEEETTILPSSRMRKFKNKPKGYLQLKVELKTIVAHEIVALEALIEPQLRPTYTVTAASANVEVYVLKEIDAHMYLGTTQSTIYQRIRQQCDQEAEHRAKRIEATRIAISGHEASKDSATFENNWILAHETQLETHSVHTPDTLDVAILGSESPEISSTHSMTRTSASPDKNAPHLPQLQPHHLAPSVPVQATIVPPLNLQVLDNEPQKPSLIRQGTNHVDRNLGAIVASPKMLSACVRKFIFEHSDTLTSAYAERLGQQFQHLQPLPPMSPTGNSVKLSSEPETSVPKPPSCRKRYSSPAGMIVKTARVSVGEQRVLEQQMSKLSTQEMQWDTDIKAYVPKSLKFELSVNPSKEKGRGKKDHERGAATCRDVSDFHQQQRSMQQTARRLVEAHLKRVQQRAPNINSHDPIEQSSSTFVHFFADM